jgi:hypothetical protein
VPKAYCVCFASFAVKGGTHCRDCDPFSKIPAKLDKRTPAPDLAYDACRGVDLSNTLAALMAETCERVNASANACPRCCVAACDDASRWNRQIAELLGATAPTVSAVQAELVSASYPPFWWWWHIQQ